AHFSTFFVLTRDRGDGHARGDVGPAVSDELLGAVDDPLAVARLRPRLSGPRVRSRLWLGQPKGPQLASRDQVGQPALLLLRRTELVDRRRAQAHRRLERDSDPRVGPTDLFDRDAPGKKPGARP